jgi:hypothetical protein
MALERIDPAQQVPRTLNDALDPADIDALPGAPWSRLEQLRSVGNGRRSPLAALVKEAIAG